MNKKNKKLQLNKQVIANLNALIGGESQKSVGGTCGSDPSLTIITNESIVMRCQIQTKDYACPYSKEACNTDYTCTPSNFGCTTNVSCSVVYC